jgi:hypothetical protein
LLNQNILEPDDVRLLEPRVERADAATVDFELDRVAIMAFLGASFKQVAADVPDLSG